MLVWIKKGLVDVQAETVDAILFNKTASGFEIEIRNIDMRGPTLKIQYELSEFQEYQEDVMALKDCLLNVKQRNNVALFNPPIGAPVLTREQIRNGDINISVPETVSHTPRVNYRITSGTTDSSYRNEYALFSNTDQNQN